MKTAEHLLLIAIEESNEIIEAANRFSHRASKALRFGPQEIQPEQQYTNAERIIHEYCDLIATVEMLQDEGILPVLDSDDLIARKKMKVEQFLTLSAECGTLTD